MKLSQYAKRIGVTYKTAWKWYKSGKIKGYQMPTGTIIITENEKPIPTQKNAVYVRVSSNAINSQVGRNGRQKK